MRKLAVLTTPAFVAALVVLLANDLYLKAAYGNWLTGKLSDAAGLTVVTSIALPWFPGGTRRVLGAIAAAFVVWKGPASQPLIDFVNARSAWQIGRVVDYTDLIALLVLPLSVRSFRARQGDGDDAVRWRRLATLPLLVATVLAITGTSASAYTRIARIDVKLAGEASPIAAAETTVGEALARAGYSCQGTSPMHCNDGKITVHVCASDERTGWLMVVGPLDRGAIGPKTGRRERNRVDELSEDLRDALAPRFEVLSSPSAGNWTNSDAPMIACR